MITLYNLPDELLLPILDDFDSQDLDNLSKTSRRFRGIAQEALHREVIITRPLSKIPVLIRSMVERPDLARRVRTLVLPIDNGPLWPTTGWHKLVREATRRDALYLRTLSTFAGRIISTADSCQPASDCSCAWYLSLRSSVFLAATAIASTPCTRQGC
jgi:hypothetical protein